MASLPVLVQRTRRGRMQTAQRSPGRPIQPTRQSHGATRRRTLHASDRVEHVCQRCGCTITRVAERARFGGPGQKRSCLQPVWAEIRAIVVPVIEGRVSPWWGGDHRSGAATHRRCASAVLGRRSRRPRVGCGCVKSRARRSPRRQRSHAAPPRRNTVAEPAGGVAHQPRDRAAGSATRLYLGPRGRSSRGFRAGNANQSARDTHNCLSLN